MALKTTIFDPAEYLDTEEEIIAFLDASMDGGDAQHIARALGIVARSKGMTEVARKTGVGRQALYAALSENGNPTLETLTAVLSAMGLRLSVARDAA
ncbi:MAG: putative addiction module antidote protein [Proteobacteria bacterium ST_bin14]|nr:MAG: putative addiction module antidote protein [Proteobacteria bacterium ST_bin14]